MTKLHELKPAEGSRHKATRKGRGIGTGLGKTAGRGHNGQNSRSGGGVRPGFEGGQMPLQQRVPKRGFTNIFKKQITAINLKDLEERFEADAVVTPEALIEVGLIKSVKDGVKILGNGEISKKITVKVHAISKSAAEKVEAAGGKVEVL